MKMKTMLHDIRNLTIFGRVVGGILSLEFQKRGLPHIHILIIPYCDDKPRITDDYDKYVCADISDLDMDLELYKTITPANINGPCRPGIPDLPGMKDGRCSNNFPKTLCEQTNGRDDSYPIYRRNNEQIYVKKRFSYDNRWTVLHNTFHQRITMLI